MHHSISISEATELEPARLHYWLANESGHPWEVASCIVDSDLPREAAIKQARQELIERARYILLSQSERVRMVEIS